MSGIPDNKQGQGENKKASSDNRRNADNYKEALKTESTKYRGKRDSRSDKSDKTVNLHKTTGDYYKQDVDNILSSVAHVECPYSYEPSAVIGSVALSKESFSDFASIPLSSVAFVLSPESN